MSVNERSRVGEEVIAVVRSADKSSERRQSTWLARALVYSWMVGWPAAAVYLLVR